MNFKKVLYNLWFNLIAVKREKNELLKGEIRKNIEYNFSQLDKNNIPFSTQNAIIELAEREESFDNNIDKILSNYI